MKMCVALSFDGESSSISDLSTHDDFIHDRDVTEEQRPNKKSKMSNPKKRSAGTPEALNGAKVSKKARLTITQLLNSRASGDIAGRLPSWKAFFDKFVGEELCTRSIFEEIRYCFLKLILSNSMLILLFYLQKSRICRSEAESCY